MLHVQLIALFVYLRLLKYIMCWNFFSKHLLKFDIAYVCKGWFD